MDTESIRKLLNISSSYRDEDDVFCLWSNINLLLYARFNMSPRMIGRISSAVYNNYGNEIVKIQMLQLKYGKTPTFANAQELNAYVLEWLAKLLCAKLIKIAVVEDIKVNYNQDLASLVSLIKQLIG